jgi:uncharacterized protein YeaO (DUF488 family)
VAKENFASGNWYDVWLPELSPSEATVKAGQREMASPCASRVLDLLAALSRDTDFSVGCYCEDESRCHRSVLRRLLRERGAKIS